MAQQFLALHSIYVFFIFLTTRLGPSAVLDLHAVYFYFFNRAAWGRDAVLDLPAVYFFLTARPGAGTRF